MSKNNEVIDEDNLKLSRLDFIDLYDCYIGDLSGLKVNNSEDNQELIIEIYNIRNSLEILFESCGCNNDILERNAIPWVDDKVNYCLNNCTDIDTLNRIKDLYGKFQTLRSKLVEGNLRLVISVAGSYCREDIDFVEVIQFGNMGLMKAVEKYIPGYNSTFSTYAYYWIKQSIISNLKKITYSLKIPSYIISDNYDRIKSISELTQVLGRNPSSKELALYMEIPLEKLDELILTFMEPISLDEPVDTIYEDTVTSRIEFIADDNVDLYEEVSNNLLRDMLSKYMSMYLSEREEMILRERYGFNGVPRTYGEIAEMLGVSYQRIGEINKKAIKKLEKIPQIKSLISYLR